VRNNQGEFAWFCLDGITQATPGGTVSFRFITYHSVFAAEPAGPVISVNGGPVSRLEQFFTPGTMIQLSADSTQLDESGRTRFDFLAWSDGGARSHNITAGEAPDTVIAQFGVAHRIRTTVQGAAPAAVMTVLGVYVSEGSQVVLRAATQPNAVFLGWTGDTTASGDTLTLLMRRPFDLIANFVEVQLVGLNNAAAALLGTGELRSEEATYLDAVGNRNGVYDLGDFLAATDRSVPPAGASSLVSSRGAP
jgi:hypothetical protein